MVAALGRGPKPPVYQETTARGAGVVYVMLMQKQTLAYRVCLSTKGPSFLDPQIFFNTVCSHYFSVRNTASDSASVFCRVGHRCFPVCLLVLFPCYLSFIQISSANISFPPGVFNPPTESVESRRQHKYILCFVFITSDMFFPQCRIAF